MTPEPPRILNYATPDAGERPSLFELMMGGAAVVAAAVVGIVVVLLLFAGAALWFITMVEASPWAWLIPLVSFGAVTTLWMRRPRRLGASRGIFLAPNRSQPYPMARPSPAGKLFR